jgi:biotin carboxyl carrier protein
MKLHATIGEQSANVEIRREGERVFATIDGRHYELEARTTSDGLLLSSAGRIFNCRINGTPESGKPLEVLVDTDSYKITLSDPKRLRGAATAGAHGDGAARIIAPMPGKVVRVMVQPGDQIGVGDGVIVVEAMKMQNEMKSPKAGAVISVRVEVGATVNGGDVLAVIE